LNRGPDQGEQGGLKEVRRVYPRFLPDVGSELREVLVDPVEVRVDGLSTPAGVLQLRCLLVPVEVEDHPDLGLDLPLRYLIGRERLTRLRISLRDGLHDLGGLPVGEEPGGLSGSIGSLPTRRTGGSHLLRCLCCLTCWTLRCRL